MSGAAVCDSSAVVALLIDDGPDGRWSTQHLSGVRLLAPSLMMFEAANIIRRHELAGLISSDQAMQAHGDLRELTIEQWPYELLGQRIWQLRANLSGYDASYVAVAELADAPLVTLDRRISKAPGLRCEVLAP